MAKRKSYVFQARDYLGRKFFKRFKTAVAYNAFKERFYREKELRENGLSLPRESTILRDYLARWLLKRQKDSPMSSFETDNQRIRTWILPFEISMRPMETITTQDFRDHLDVLGRDHGLSKATRNRIRALLHKVYQDALRDDPPYVRVNPLSAIQRFSEAKPESQDKNMMPSMEICRAYLSELKKEGMPYWIWGNLSLFCGLRKSESLALQRRDIDFNQSTIHVRRLLEQVSMTLKARTKAGEAESRMVGIHPDLASLLKEYLEVHPFKEPEALLVCERDGSLITPFKITHYHAKVCKRLGVVGVTPHGLRHTFATQYLQHGGNHRDLQELLGHSSEATTNRYKHLQPNYFSARARVLTFGEDPAKAFTAEVLPVIPEQTSAESPKPTKIDTGGINLDAPALEKENERE